MHVLVTASSTVGRNTRIWRHVQYVRHHGIRSGEMILAMLRVKNVIARKKISVKVMWYAPIIP